MLFRLKSFNLWKVTFTGLSAHPALYPQSETQANWLPKSAPRLGRRLNISRAYTYYSLNGMVVQIKSY